MLHGEGSKLALSKLALSKLAPFTVQVLNIDFLDKDPSRKKSIRPRLLSPLNAIAMLSCAISVGLMAWAIVLEDGVGLTGILVMSITTPLLCIGLKWSPGNMVVKVKELDKKRHPRPTSSFKPPLVASPSYDATISGSSDNSITIPSYQHTCSARTLVAASAVSLVE
jgi:hypothetical protein